ncbi:hypothetical protein HPP92_020104 [Vanilla planifolia]|uniref:Uncharacterized protein n=1 Tax=Vanilla planifolia TaxID=51239 RepID=A0A835UKG6_VANPL|nr:hypothetical protein HPP92_020104 [Vanilla planifolia]
MEETGAGTLAFRRGRGSKGVRSSFHEGFRVLGIEDNGKARSFCRQLSMNSSSLEASGDRIAADEDKRERKRETAKDLSINQSVIFYCFVN